MMRTAAMVVLLWAAFGMVLAGIVEFSIGAVLIGIAVAVDLALPRRRRL